MQLYTALLICILVLSLTGGLAPFRSIFGLGRFQAAFFALSMLALSSFDFAFNPETHLNLGVLALPVWLLFWARSESWSTGAPASLALFSLLAFGAERAGLFAGAQSGLLTGFIAGAAAAALAGTPKTALAVACSIPLCTALLSSAYILATGGYVEIDFARIALRDAQLTALCFGGVLLCMYFVAKGAAGVAKEEERPKEQE